MRPVIRRAGVGHHHAAGGGEETPPPPSFIPGINGGYGSQDISAGELLKPKMVRIGLLPSEMTPEIVEYVAAHYAKNFGALANICVEFSGPEKVSNRFTSAQAKSFKNIAHIPGVSCYEIGNETSYGYQYSDGVGTESYKLRAREYAQRVKETGEALAEAGSTIGCSCQADDGNSGSSQWVDEMYAAVPNLHEYIAAWTIHPYPKETTGNCKPRIERLISQVGAHGGSGKSIDITEWGISSANGRTLEGGSHLTYTEAATIGAATYKECKEAAGSKLRQFVVYQIRDQQPISNTSTNREFWFGALQNGLSAKGKYTEFIESVLKGE